MEHTVSPQVLVAACKRAQLRRDLIEAKQAVTATLKLLKKQQDEINRLEAALRNASQLNLLDCEP